MQFVMQARSRKIAQLIESCARRHITLAECCEQIAAMGFKTTSVYEMVRSAEEQIKEIEAREKDKDRLHCITEYIDYTALTDKYE